MPPSSGKEKILNVPNALTLLRVFIAVVTIILVFAGFDIFYIISFLLAGMLTDLLDGQIARRFNLKTEFGRMFDMIADRILMVGVTGAVILKLGFGGFLQKPQIFQIVIMLLREIISIPFFLSRIFYGNKTIPQVRIIGKATTVLQAITFPMILLSKYYEIFNVSWYFAIATGIVGFISALYYLRDTKNL